MLCQLVNCRELDELLIGAHTVKCQDKRGVGNDGPGKNGPGKKGPDSYLDR